jgi:predicted kinase
MRTEAYLGGDGISSDEWERSHEIALQKMSVTMTKGQDIALDDTCCFRWLRDRYRDHATGNGYSVQLVYMDVPTDEIHRRIAANSSRAQRRAIAPDVLAEHLRTFEKPAADEAAIVLSSPQSISEWVSSLNQRESR